MFAIAFLPPNVLLWESFHPGYAAIAVVAELLESERVFRREHLLSLGQFWVWKN